MNSKLTLNFDSEVIEKAKEFASKNNISLSRLTEYIFRNITTHRYKTLDELPISDWVLQVSEGSTEYHKRSSKQAKKEYYESKK